MGKMRKDYPHDTLEDGNITPSELLSLGFSQEIVDLVRLCSHNPTIENGTARWLLMVANLTTARNIDAWAIKLTDLSDNLTESSGLSPDNQRFMIETKAPLLLRLTEQYPELEAYREILKEETGKAKIAQSVKRENEMDDYTMDSLIRGIQS